jgi:hypothetical protein
MPRKSALLLVALLCAHACANSEMARLKETTRATYDKTTGRLKELTYDSNANGRIDTWTEMDGARALRSRIDRNEDGKIDRWEYYDDSGRLIKVGFSRRDDGKLDAWAYSGDDGKVNRIDISSTGDDQKIERREYYEPSPAGPGDQNALARAEEDTNRDGKVDKWETYENGAIKTVAFDENGDGLADRRLTYAQSALLSIESQPDARGRFASRIAVK